MTLTVRTTAIALALIVLAAGLGWVRARPDHPPLRVPGPTRVGAHPVAPAPRPTARGLLAQAEPLGLTGTQRRRLAELDRRWLAESVSLEAEAQAAGQAVSQYLQEAQAGRGASLPEIQRRSADYQQVSVALREARQRQAEAVREVLTASQREHISQQSALVHGGAR